MDYMRETVEYLKNYSKLIDSIDNLRDEIAELRIDIKSLSGVGYSDMPFGGGIREPDDRIINKMVRLTKAEEEYKMTKRTIKRIEKAFERFKKENENYYKILKGYFIDQYTEEQLMKDFNYSDRHLRRLKQRALKAFAIEIYGIKVIA